MRQILLSVLFGILSIFAGEGKISYISSPLVDGGEIEIYLQTPDTVSKKLLVSIWGASSTGVQLDEERKKWYSHWIDKGYNVAEISLPGFGGTSGKKDLYGPLSVGTLNYAIDVLKAEYKIDRVGIIGLGSGGATALLLTAQRDDICCLVCANGVANLKVMKDNPDWVSRFLSRDYDLDLKDEEALNIRTPIFQVEAINTPLFILHRFPNRFIDLEDVEEFSQAMDARGKECKVSIQNKRPEDHETRVSRQEILDVAEDWFDQHMTANDSGYDQGFVELVEYIYGLGYLSQGGKDSTFSQFDGIDLNGKRLLDIGCGLGGRDIDLVKTFDVEVVGIDPEPFLIEVANKHLLEEKELMSSVTFQLTSQPLTLSQFSTNSFDVLASREALLHIPLENKEDYFKEMFRVLKPGGQFAIVDWIRKNPYSEDTIKMMEMDGVAFHMLSLEEYKTLLGIAGFVNVQVINETTNYITYTDQNIETICNSQQDFIQRFGQEEFTYALQSWNFQKCAFENREIQVIKILAERVYE